MSDKSYEVISAYLKAKMVGINVHVDHEYRVIEFNGHAVYSIEQMEAFIKGFKNAKNPNR